MKCAWEVNEQHEKCTRKASVVLTLSKPCGHFDGGKGVPTCPGHGEAHIGSHSPAESLCVFCGVFDYVYCRPEDWRLL